MQTKTVKMKHPISGTIIATCFLILPFASFSQCNVFVKKKCMPKIQPFTNNGQMNTSMVEAGQSTRLDLTCYSGQDYRILVCAQEILGEVTFKVFDATRKVIFESKDHDNTDFWDFKSRSTQQLTVEVNVPKSDNPSSVPPSGCVSVMVGFKKD
jgi:hypothetical protein